MHLFLEIGGSYSREDTIFKEIWYPERGFLNAKYFRIRRGNWGCACADASAINHRLGDLNSIYYCRKSPFFTVLLIRHSTGITISNNKRLWEASQNWNLLYLSKIETLEKNIFQLRVPLMFPPLGLLINYVDMEGEIRSHIHSTKCLLHFVAFFM